MTILIRVPAGDLIDKISILEIKSIKIKDKSKFVEITKELKYLNRIYIKTIKNKTVIDGLKKKLFKINSKLWNIENKIRELEADKNFNNDFIKTARSVYQWNDKRAKIKNKINELTNSEFKEIKEYTKY